MTLALPLSTGCVSQCHLAERAGPAFTLSLDGCLYVYVYLKYQVGPHYTIRRSAFSLSRNSRRFLRLTRCLPLDFCVGMEFNRTTMPQFTERGSFLDTKCDQMTPGLCSPKSRHTGCAVMTWNHGDRRGPSTGLERERKKETVSCTAAISANFA